LGRIIHGATVLTDRLNFTKAAQPKNGPPPTRTLVANSEISTLQVRQVPENSVYQDASLRENEFATSVNNPVIKGNKGSWGATT
jgi:hypothetical protein